MVDIQVNAGESKFQETSVSSSSTVLSSSVVSNFGSASFSSSSSSVASAASPTLLPPDREIRNSSSTVLYQETSVTGLTFPVYAIVIVVALFVAMTSVAFYFCCRCISRKRKRNNQLSKMTPKASDPRMAGVRADQTIQFVVPTTIVVSETTEDSLSETDYSSSGSKNLGMMSDRRRKRASSSFLINPGDLEKGLYEGVKVGPENGTFLGDLGKVGFSLHYNHLRRQLYVRLIGAVDLPCLFMKTTANPCAKVILLPDKSPKYISKVQRNTVHPVFNETFVFPLQKEDLESKKIKISVWDYDRFSRKLLIGQVVYAVKDGGISSALTGDTSTGDVWMDLRKESESRRSCGCGELLLSLSYNPDSASLTLAILKVRGLVMGEKEKDTVVYGKLTLYVRRKLVRTKKTSSKKKLPEVEFNNTFHIRVLQGSLSEVDLLVTLCESSGIAGKRVIGRTQVGSNCISDQGLQHWQDMIVCPKSTCAQWHTLCG